MAYDYWFYMFGGNDILKPEEVGKALIDQFAVRTYDSNADFGVPGVSVTVRNTIDEVREERHLEHGGVTVSFRHSREPGIDHRAADVNLLRMIDWLLRHYRAAVEFEGDYEELFLFRDGNRVVLVNSDYWTYDPCLLPTITIPHECRNVSRTHWLEIPPTGNLSDPMALRGYLIAMFQLLPHKEYHTEAYSQELSVVIGTCDEEPRRVAVGCSPNLLHYHAGVRKMLEMYRLLLDRFPGDARMTWKPEHLPDERPVLLTRTNDKIILCDEPDFWTPERKAVILGKP